MIKIAFIVPNKDLVDLVRRTYKEHSRQYSKDSGDSIPYSFFVYVAATIYDVPAQALDADILIARGMIISKLKQSNPHIAVVEVPIGSEMVSTIYKAVNLYGRLPIAVVGSFNMLYAAYGIEDVLDVDIKSYLQTSNHPREIKAITDRMLKEGRKIIICGANTHAYASTRDCHSVLLGMSKESIWQAISEAKHGAVIKREEREKSVQYQTVLNHSHEGIIATGLNNDIKIFNVAAEDILHMPARDAIGKSIDDVLPSGHLSTVLRGRSDFTDKIVKYGDDFLSVNKVGLSLSGEFTGHIITLQKSATIQRTESKLRQKLYGKGHVAHYHFDDIIGSSPGILSAIEAARNYANVTSNILIVGDTGTGKEMFAQSIHNESSRRKGPFVAINCAALSKSLLESELFGYVAGAFTGAAKGGKPGLFELAHTGSVFLDEISEIPMDLQGRLLRVLQERQIMRLGDDKVIPIDVRIISASNKPLMEQVRDKNFRKDLYYRLNVLLLQLPSLNERETDTLQIAVRFLSEYCDRFQKQAITLSDKACDMLVKHQWEGNIRELRNVCERLAVLNNKSVITHQDLEQIFDEKMTCAPTEQVISYSQELRRFEQERIRNCIRHCNGDREKAAKQLGISKTTLWRRMKSLDIS